MSSDKRISLWEALGIAQGLRPHMASLCAEYTVAGSVRREARMVGDIEIVVIPHNNQALYARLDRMVEDGVIKKAMYKTAHGTSPRWGEKLRCFRFKGVTVELAIADEHNYGYKLWLRTGPADGNQWIMSRLSHELAPVRFHDGYGWLVEYIGQTPRYVSRLHLPDETELFRALNMDYIDPKWRSEAAYRANWRGALDEWGLRGMLVKELKQRRLF